jgi:hypothetical protein
MYAEALTGSGGTIVERDEYDAYGHPYILEPNFAADADGNNGSLREST